MTSFVRGTKRTRRLLREVLSMNSLRTGTRDALQRALKMLLSRCSLSLTTPSIASKLSKSHEAYHRSAGRTSATIHKDRLGKRTNDRYCSGAAKFSIPPAVFRANHVSPCTIMAGDRGSGAAHVRPARHVLLGFWHGRIVDDISTPARKSCPRSVQQAEELLASSRRLSRSNRQGFL